MNFGEIAGYVAAILVFATFYMHTMVPMRLLAIGSNIAFIAYGWTLDLMPALLLHSALLPLNILRLRQLLRLVADMRDATSGELPLQALVPFMRSRRFTKGEVLFHRDDAGSEMYFVRRGVVHLPEIDKRLEAGEPLGEISLFSPTGERTTSAVGETDGELLSLTQEDVLRLYHQQPQFGFYLIRFITHRLIENAAATSSQGRLAGALASLPLPVAATAAKPAPGTAPWRPPTRDEPRFGWSSSIGWPVAVVGAFAALVFLAGPYLRTVVYRDAAVTTWVNTATAPIRGSLQGELPPPGARIGPDGTIALVRDHAADPSEVERRKAALARTEAEVEQLRRHRASLVATAAAWKERTGDYARTFSQNLDIEVEGINNALVALRGQLDLERQLAERQATLAARGDASQSAADAARSAVRALERQYHEEQARLENALARREAAAQGVFLLGDGRNPGWTQYDWDRLELDLAETSRALADAEAALAEARAAAIAADTALRLGSEALVRAAPRSMIWSVHAGDGAAVDAGDPVAAWVDCSVMLLDVPVSDAEIGLLRVGMPAEAVIDGERAVRTGTVLLTRGAASKLDGGDLAATATGHAPRTGQAIVGVDMTPTDAESCPVGAAASVDFPDVGLLDIVRARMRI